MATQDPLLFSASAPRRTRLQGDGTHKIWKTRACQSTSSKARAIWMSAAADHLLLQPHSSSRRGHISSTASPTPASRLGVSPESPVVFLEDCCGTYTIRLPKTEALSTALEPISTCRNIAFPIQRSEADQLTLFDRFTYPGNLRFSRTASSLKLLALYAHFVDTIRVCRYESKAGRW